MVFLKMTTRIFKQIYFLQTVSYHLSIGHDTLCGPWFVLTMCTEGGVSVRGVGCPPTQIETICYVSMCNEQCDCTGMKSTNKI